MILYNTYVTPIKVLMFKYDYSQVRQDSINRMLNEFKLLRNKKWYINSSEKIRCDNAKGYSQCPISCLTSTLYFIFKVNSDAPFFRHKYDLNYHEIELIMAAADNVKSREGALELRLRMLKALGMIPE